MSTPTSTEQQQESFDPKTFDAHAALYEELFHLPYRQHLELPLLTQLFGDLTGLKVLDFGCGPGVMARWLHGLGADVTGYDISSGMIQYANERAKKDNTPIQYFSNIDQLQLGSFDLVLAVYVVPYAVNRNDLHQMLNTMAKLLKKGGKIISLAISDDFHKDPEYYRKFGIRLIQQTPREDGNPQTLNICFEPHNIDITAYYWSTNTLEIILKQVGFSQISWPSYLNDFKSQSYPEELKPYHDVPHASIVMAIKDE